MLYRQSHGIYIICLKYLDTSEIIIYFVQPSLLFIPSLICSPRQIERKGLFVTPVSFLKVVLNSLFEAIKKRFQSRIRAETIF